MEESTEAHMETDVSSTTEDIPQTQELSGSHGNVEMVIVIEKMGDDEDSNDQNEKESSFSELNVTESVEKLPKRDEEPSNSILESPIKEIGPLNIIEKPASELGTPETIVEKDMHLNNTVTSPPPSQQVETTVSSSKVETSSPNSIEKKLIQVKTINTPLETEQPSVSSPVEENLRPAKTNSPEVLENLNDSSEFKISEVKLANEKVNKTSHIVLPVDITIERDVSNDSQNEQTIEEKEHNKSLSRELKSLINSAKESKIISECTQITSKIRKSRTPLDSSNTSQSLSFDPEKLQGVRRHSNHSQKSSCSEKSETVALKRSMRSQNPEFVSKVKQFLNSVTNKVQKDSDEGTDDETIEIKINEKREIEPSPSRSTSKSSTPKRKRIADETVNMLKMDGKLQSDLYCWRCHWDVDQTNEKTHAPMYCTICPRTYHYKCLSAPERSKIDTEKSWVCTECMIILNAESSETRSPAMKKISLSMLSDLLKHALQRMMEVNGIEPFMSPVDRDAFPSYDKYVVHPMDLSLMKCNIEAGAYGSTEAFLADANWILHNSIIFNTLQSKLTGAARALVRLCRSEMGEIEACPECYAGAHARRATWFTDVCSTPHILLWAKLKGFPYWPAKGMTVNSSGLVDVRFFGAHDRAWVPSKDCFLYSEKDPNNFRTKRQDILDSMQEAEQHIRNISRKYGKFVYPPFKTQLEPSKLTEQLKMMIPSFEGEVRVVQKNKCFNASPISNKDKSRSNSKSSKNSSQEGDVSEVEDSVTLITRKKLDIKDVSKADDDQSNGEKDDVMEIDETPNKKENEFRKRRRSDLDEGVITIIESSSVEKRKKINNDLNVNNLTLEKQQEPCSSKEETPKERRKKNEKVDKVTDVDLSLSKKYSIENKEKSSVLKRKDEEEPSSSTTDRKAKTPKMTPIKIIVETKNNKVSIKNPVESMPKTSTPNEKPMKPIRIEKEGRNEKELKDKHKTHKRRSSKSNKSLNISNPTKPDKSIESNEKIIDFVTFNQCKNISVNEKNKDTNSSTLISDKTSSSNISNTCIQIDDDINLATIAREVSKNGFNGEEVSMLPTISCVRSLSTLSQNTSTTATKTTSNSKTIDITIEANPNSSIFIPTSTDNIKTVQDAQSKLQKLRNDAENVVGKVGVKSFARMTSPDCQSKNNDLQIEIKSEPIDLEDDDRNIDRMKELMSSFKLVPAKAQAQAQNLREVRINKMVVSPLTTKKPTKPPEIRSKAKKSFPQPKKPDEGRSELNSKNSMVYIPIQPPIAQPPIRPTRPAMNGPVTTTIIRPVAASNTTTVPVQNIVNTQTPPPLNALPMTPLANVPTTTSGPSTNTQNIQNMGQVQTIGQVPTTVHTVPLMTSVNGQWMLSLQPVMSVGVDHSPTPPMVNGMVERNNVGTNIVALNTNAALTSGGAVVTPNLVSTATKSPANKTNENAPGEPPRLQQRPPLVNPFDASSPTALSVVPPPPSAGPLTAKLNQSAVKLADFFRNLLEDSLEKIDEPETVVTTLRLQLENAKWRHQQEIEELKHNQELSLAEMRASFEKEMMRALNDARRVAQTELATAVKQTKLKQWCANCNQEAQYYCCWNTSYCDYPCQKVHWSQHFSACAQQKSQDINNGGSIPIESRLQPQLEKMPRKVAIPAMAVGGKVAPRPSVPAPPQKSALIVTMLDDPNGSQAMKCAGTYKPTQTQSPMIINKQIMNKEDTAKKVVTSGGYLIVGAGAPNNSTVVTPSRRTHSNIQYIQTT